MDSKSKYIELCSADTAIPLFMRPEWLDCIDGSWNVVLVEKGNAIVAALPYLIQKKYGFTLSPTSLLGTYDGIWISYPEGQKEASKLSYEKEVIGDLLDQLPPLDLNTIKLHPSITNHLPFFWKGYKQTTKYTYVIDDLPDIEKLIEDFNGNIRREIKKAEKSLRIDEKFDPELLYQLKTKDKRDPVNYSKGLLGRIVSFCKENKAGAQLTAKDQKGNVHASILFVWDKEYCYYLIGGSDADYRTSGAMSLLMLEGIKLASKHSSGFNFGGSMIESIERFFRGFGAKQLPYFEVEKTNSRLLQLLLLLKRKKA